MVRIRFVPLFAMHTVWDRHCTAEMSLPCGGGFCQAQGEVVVGGLAAGVRPAGIADEVVEVLATGDLVEAPQPALRTMAIRTITARPTAPSKGCTRCRRETLFMAGRRA